MNDVTVVATQMEEFGTALTEGINGLFRAGQIYVEAIDADPKNADLFKDAFKDWVPSATWGQLESIGRKQIHPRLLLGGTSSPATNRLLKRLPYSLQERVFSDERFPLLTSSGQPLQVSLLDVTPEQAEQLCDNTTIRSLAAQKAWLESHLTSSQEKEAVKYAEAVRPPWRYYQGKVIFTAGAALTKQELRNILMEM